MSESNNEYDINLLELALATQDSSKSSAVVPRDEAASLANEHQQTAKADEPFQKSDYELQRDQRMLRNQEPLKSLGLPTQPATAIKKRKKSGKEKGGRPPLEKRPRSSRLQAKAVVNNNKEPTGWDGSKVVLCPKQTLKISFAHVLARFQKFHPDDDDGGKRGRFSMAKCLADCLKQYMVDGCPCLHDTKWNYVKKIFNQQQQTARSEGSSENQAAPPSPHRLVHLPKTTKFLGAQIVASKCAYPQFACRGGCGKRVRTYCSCSCSPGQTMCNECFVPHTVKCDAEAAAEAALLCLF